MKVLLTGVTGFLGSHVLEFLLKNNCEVVGLLRTQSSRDRLPNEKPGSFKLYNVDEVSFKEIFQTEKIDCIIHMATEYGRNSTPVSTVLNSNLIFPLSLIETAIQFNVKTFINTDSYFNKNEHFFYSGLPNYSLSKKSFLSWIEKLSENIQIVNIYLEHIYGPHDSKSKFVENIIQSVAIEQIKEFPMTHGHQRRDFIYVDDVVDAYFKILLWSEKSRTKIRNFQLGTGESIQIRDFAMLVKSLSQSKTELRLGQIDYRQYEIMDSKADLTNMNELGWKARTDITSGLKAILGKYKT